LTRVGVGPIKHRARLGALFIAAGLLVELAAMSSVPLSARVDAHRIRLQQLMRTRDTLNAAAAAADETSAKIDRAWGAYGAKIARVAAAFNDPRQSPSTSIIAYRRAIIDQANDTSLIVAFEHVGGPTADDAQFQRAASAFLAQYHLVRRQLVSIVPLLTQLIDRPSIANDQHVSDTLAEFNVAEEQLGFHWVPVSIAAKNVTEMMRRALEVARDRLDIESDKSAIEALLDP
jgi:hypothetical protein